MEKVTWWHTLVFLFLIIAVAIFFRFAGLQSIPPGLHPDEATNGNNALQAIETGEYRLFYPDNHGREGLFINIQSLSLRLFGLEPWALRGVSALFGALTIVGIYLLTKELLSWRVGLLSSFLAAVSFWHINFSRIGFRAISAPFFLVFGFYFLLKAFRELKTKIAYWYAGLSGIFLGLGFHTYIAYRLMPLLLLAFIVLWWIHTPREMRNKFIGAAAACLFVIFLVGFPIGLYFLNNPGDFAGRSTDVSIFRMPAEESLKNVGLTMLMFNVVGDWNWRHNFAGRPLLWWPVGISFLIGITLSCKAALRKETHIEGALPLLWLGIMLIPNLLSPEGSPHALRALVTLPAVFLVAGIGGIWVWDKTKQFSLFLFPRYGHVFALYLLCWMLLMHITVTARNYFFWGIHPSTRNAFTAQFLEEGRVLRDLPATIPKYAVFECDNIPVQGCHSAQTVLFTLGGWNEARWKEKNVRFIRERELTDVRVRIPEGALLVPIMKKESNESVIEARWPDAQKVDFGYFIGYRIP